MNLVELAKELRRRYEDAGAGQKVAMIHLFGIKYSDEIRACAMAAATRVSRARLPESDVTEMNKGCKLARFVEIKRGVL